jgi:hypothetical protein
MIKLTLTRFSVGKDRKVSIQRSISKLKSSISDESGDVFVKLHKG